MPLKRFGQNFLQDSRITERMVEYAGVTKEDVVLEVGPGHGILTNELSRRAKRVVAIERDKKLVPEISGLWKNVEVVQGDALEVPFPRFDKFVASIPFNISSPLTFKLFKHDWTTAVVIYQKEFAERFFAKPGEKHYSRLTVAVNYYAKPELLERVSHGKFWPMPKVDACIVRLTKREPPFPTDEAFWETINRLFQHKKKTVAAALKASKLKGTVPAGFEKKRIFQCTLEDLRKITSAVSRTCS